MKLSVVMPVYNERATLRAVIDRVLAVDPAVELLCVDDGSSDSTREVASRWKSNLQLSYFRQGRSGASAARNLGIFAADARLILFFDDDEIAAEALLEQHVEAHRAFPGDHQAVLGYTQWLPGLRITPLMHYVVEVGCYLLSYRYVARDRPALERDRTCAGHGRSAMR